MIASAELIFGFVLIFALLSIAALVGVVMLIVKGIFSAAGHVLRSLFGTRHKPCCGPGWANGPRPDKRSPAAGGVRVCSRAGCHYRNRPEAAYCSRCGKRLY